MSWIEIINAWGSTVCGIIPWRQLQVQLFTRILRLLAFLVYKHEFTHVHASTPREQQLQGSEVAPYARANLIAFLFQMHGSPLESVRLKGLMNNASHCSPRSLPYCHALCLTLVNNPKSALRILHALHNCALKGLGFRWLLPTEWVLECSVLRANVEVCSSDFLL